MFRNSMVTLGSLIVLIFSFPTVVIAQKIQLREDAFISYVVNPKKQNIQFYWKDNNQQNFRSLFALKSWLQSQNKKLVFAMNGGMYKRDNSPQGLFIENGKRICVIDTLQGVGNFYLKPNGVFYITKNNLPGICNTIQFVDTGTIKYATQSGPMLIINGQIHPAFQPYSTNVNIRNGVGILPNNTILFAMSKKEINFYDFANYFKSKGCKNALYLDGLVSKTYLPEKNWMQSDGDFGVLIGVTTYGK